MNDDHLDRRYRYRITPRSGGYHAYVGGMQRDDMDPVTRDSKTILFPDEVAALRGAIDTLLKIIHADILAWRSPDMVALRKPSAIQEIASVFGDSDTVYAKPNKPVTVVRKRRRKIA